MRYRYAEAVLTVPPSSARLAAANGRMAMTERSYEQMQARALNNLDNAYGENAGSADQGASLARAQVHALLAVGAAIKDLADAIRESR